MLWGGVSHRAEVLGVRRLASLVGARDSEVDQTHVTRRRHHDVARLEVAHDDRRTLAVQVSKHVTDADHPVENITLWQWGVRLLLSLLQRHAGDIFHHE